MENDKKYQLCISVQQRVLNELREEFAVSTVNKKFPSCVSYQNGEYIYDLDVIGVIFTYYFKENFTYLSESLNDSKESFAKAVLKGMIHAGKNIKNIRLQKEFREKFLKKSSEIMTKYFKNPDENDKNNLKVQIKEWNKYIQCADDDEFDEDFIRESINDILDNFTEDLRTLKNIRSEVFRNDKR